MCLTNSDSEKILRAEMEAMSFEELKEAILEKIKQDKTENGGTGDHSCQYYFRKKLPEEIESIIVLSGYRLEYFKGEWAY